MDFEVQDSPELVGFRQEVRAWVESSAPPRMRMPLERALRSPEVREWACQFQHQLADRGWAAPPWPREYGGGGLTPAHDIIVQEELDSLSVPQLYETNRQVAAAILAWGSEGQKRRFMRPLLRGDITAWRRPADAETVADPESVKTQAVKEGDVYLVTGEETFFGGLGQPTYLWALAVTDPDAPARRRLGAFLIPTDLPGITISDVETIVRAGQHSVTLDEAPVPVEYRIGDGSDGWMVAQSSLTAEGEADRSLQEYQSMVGKLIRYCNQTIRGRRPLLQYRPVQEAIGEALINAQVLRLMSLRNRWMSSNRQEMTFQGAQYAMLAKSMRQKLASAMLEIMGPFALLDDPKWAPLEGEAEAFQRAGLPGVNPGEGVDLEERMIATTLGL